MSAIHSCLITLLIVLINYVVTYFGLVMPYPLVLYRGHLITPRSWIISVPNSRKISCNDFCFCYVFVVIAAQLVVFFFSFLELKFMNQILFCFFILTCLPISAESIKNMASAGFPIAWPGLAGNWVLCWLLTAHSIQLLSFISHSRFWD